MSEKHKEVFTCDNCHKEFTITVYSSINVTLNPELKNKIMNDKIFSFTCPHCHKKHYIQYPFLYHDMKNKFMIKLDNPAALMEYEEKEVKGNFQNLSNDFSGMLSDIKVIGATNYIDLKSKIIMLENGLDYRIGTLYELLTLSQFNQYMKEKEESKFKGTDCYFDYNEEGKLYTIIEFENVDIPNKYGRFPVEFDELMYDDMEKDLIEKVNEVYTFFFDHIAVHKLMSIKEEDIEGYKQAIIELADIELVNGERMLAFVPEFNECKYNIGEQVILMKHRMLIKGKIIKFYHMSRYSMPMDLDNMFVVAWKVKHIELEVTYNSNEKLDNVTLKEDLKKHKKDYKFNRDLFANADCIVPFTLTLKDDASIDPKNLDVGDELSIDSFNTHFRASNMDGLRYLHVYLNQEDIHKDGLSQMIYNLDNLVDFILNNPEEFQGIIINPDSTKFKLDIAQLITYKGERILCSREKMVRLLKSLKPEEIEYMGKTSYDAICNAYFSDSTPRKIAEKMGISFEEIDIAFKTGYWCLKHIVWDNYIFENAEDAKKDLASA